MAYRFQASIHGQKSSPPSLFADLSELASNSQDSDLGATQPARPSPGARPPPLRPGPSQTLPSPPVLFVLCRTDPPAFPNPPPDLQLHTHPPHVLFHGRADRALHRGSMRPV